MNDSQARKNILNRISEALSTSTPMSFPDDSIGDSFFKTEQEPLTSLFERKFTNLLGKFFLFDNAAALKEKLHALINDNKWAHVCSPEPSVNQLLGQPSSPFISTGDLSNADAAITDCVHLIANTGTVVLRSDQAYGRALPVYAPVHIVVAFAHQLVFDLKECMEKLMLDGAEELPSMLVFASGPSRTGDIEKTLVVGVHGPREVYVLMQL